MLSRQGTKHAYGADSGDAVRLVRDVAAILSFGAGLIHISAASDHTELPVMFAGFMLVAALQIALGALLLRRPPGRLIIAGALAMTLSSIGLWLLSRTAGLPFIEDGHREAIGVEDGVTKLFEIATIPMLLLLLSSELARVSLPSRRLGGQTRAAVGTACIALMVPALVLGEGTQHSHERAVALGAHGEHEASDTVAHAGSAAHTDGEHGGAEHGQRAHGASESDHVSSTHSDHGLGHTELASTLGATHQHSTADTHTHSEPTHDHGGAQHHKSHRDGDKHHGGDHDHGHGGGDHATPDAEPAVSISYEPEPRICVGGALCVP